MLLFRSDFGAALCFTIFFDVALALAFLLPLLSSFVISSTTAPGSAQAPSPEAPPFPSSEAPASSAAFVPSASAFFFPLFLFLVLFVRYVVQCVQLRIVQDWQQQVVLRIEPPKDFHIRHFIWQGPILFMFALPVHTWRINTPGLQLSQDSHVGIAIVFQSDCQRSCA